VFRDGFDAAAAWREGVDVEFPTSAWRLARQRYPEGTATVMSAGTPKAARPKSMTTSYVRGPGPFLR
jgi:hypothetical protein